MNAAIMIDGDTYPRLHKGDLESLKVFLQHICCTGETASITVQNAEGNVSFLRYQEGELFNSNQNYEKFELV